MPRIRHAVAACLAVLLLAQACKREDNPRYPTGGTATGYPPPSYGPAPGPTVQPTAPPPASAPTSPAPATPDGPPGAAGLPCSSDADFICPFGRCLGGRCGGCRRETDCKPGATCASTPVGMTCVPSMAPAPAPTPTAPAPAPTPAPTAPPAPTPTTPPAPAPDSFAAARERCLKRTNEYRATKKLPALTLRAQSSSCADGQAQSDATSKTPHGSFGKCGELAQNECPGWKGSTDVVVDTCIKAMFDEGPGAGPAHGHHNNIMDASYTALSCGFFVASDGSVWLVQNFHR